MSAHRQPLVLALLARPRCSETHTFIRTPSPTMAAVAAASSITLGAFPKASGLRRAQVSARCPLPTNRAPAPRTLDGTKKKRMARPEEKERTLQRFRAPPPTPGCRTRWMLHLTRCVSHSHPPSTAPTRRCLPGPPSRRACSRGGAQGEGSARGEVRRVSFAVVADEWRARAMKLDA